MRSEIHWYAITRTYEKCALWTFFSVYLFSHYMIHFNILYLCQDCTLLRILPLDLCIMNKILFWLLFMRFPTSFYSEFWLIQKLIFKNFQKKQNKLRMPNILVSCTTRKGFWSCVLVWNSQSGLPFSNL